MRLVGPALTAGYAGLVAVPVRLPDAGTVDLLEVGDRVDLVAADPQAAAAPASSPPACRCSRSRASARRRRRGLPVRLVVVGAVRLRRTAIADAGRDFLLPSPVRVLAASVGRRAMTGFKNFVLRGNLVEIAVAVDHRRRVRAW